MGNRVSDDMVEAKAALNYILNEVEEQIEVIERRKANAQNLNIDLPMNETISIKEDQ